MKKLSSILLIFLILINIFIPSINVNAGQKVGIVTAADSLNVRTGPGTNYPKISGALLAIGTSVNLVDDKLRPSEGDCSVGWYEVYYAEGKTGFVCGLYLTITEVGESEEDTREPVTEYEKELKDKGFPSSYWDSLSKLHVEHPNWVFNAYDTNIDWNTFIAAESVVGKSLTNSTRTGYYSTAGGSFDWLNDTYFMQEAGGWYAASPELIAYNADPRNWLYEERIFMFEDLTYHSDYQTIDVVNSIFTTDSYPNSLLKSYSQNYMNVVNQNVNGIDYSISPVHLATRSRLELGLGVRTQITGESTATYNGFSLKGYYNFFNIGSYADSVTSSPVTRGLAYACGPACGFGTTYGRPWDTAEKAIAGGAQFIISNYFSRGQNTIYFEKWDVTSSNKFTNQYMTNVMAPYSEGNIVYVAYKNANALNNPIVFTIPVFDNMPATVSPEPNPGNQNNRLNDIKVDGKTINGFSHDMFDYKVSVSSAASSVKLEASQINSKATVSGVGSIKLTGNETKATIKVTAENGKIQEYNITFVKTAGVEMSVTDIVNNSALKNDGYYISGLQIGMSIAEFKNIINKTSATATINVTDANGGVKSNSMATGDNIKICNGSECKDYVAVIVGDPDGDGEVTIIDLLKVQKDILNSSKLVGAYKKAADTDKDGSITIIDLLKVQKQILGDSKIEQ